MSVVLTKLSPGWINVKDELLLSDNFGKVINFFVFSTPCDHTSSRGISMKKLGWDKDVWKNGDLREYLFEFADLKRGENYSKAERIDEMDKKFQKIQLDGSFQKCRTINKIGYYSDGRSVDVLTIFYYIRCSLAHGRFQIYEDRNGNDHVYVMEAAKRIKKTDDYEVRARMILKESTLLRWIDAIKEGQDGLTSHKEACSERLKQDVYDYICSDSPRSKKMICDYFNLNNYVIQKSLSALSDENRIAYNGKHKQWESIM